MKTNNQFLLYDDLCPLCVWYSGLFVRYRLLAPSNRQPFSSASSKLLSFIDQEKGRNEIPLIDPIAGVTIYGLDAILTIIGNRFSWIQKAGTVGPIYWILKKVYTFISFNRKVIVAKKCRKGQFDCSPEFNIPYRSYFIFFSLVCTLLCLNAIHQTMVAPITVYKVSSSQFKVATLLLLLSWFSVGMFMKFRIAMEYFGQISMLLILGLLISGPLLLLNKLLFLPSLFSSSYSLVVFIFIGKEYFHRMQFIPKPFHEVNVFIFHATTFCCFIYYLFNTTI